MRRTPRTTTSPAGGASNAPAASGADTSVPADAATPGGSATPVKPARSTTRAPRTPATPRATSTPRAPAKKKPAAAALAEDVSVPTTTPATPAAAEPATSPARVTVTRTPAARKAPVKPAVAKATRLPATTTSTADTAEAVEAAAAASEQDLPAGPVEVGPEKPKTAAARSSSARTAASKAAAAKAAAAKTESATKAGAARAAATKSAAAKSAAARTAATASARAATAAAAAAAAARSAAVDDAPAAAESVTEEPVKAPVTAVPDPAAPATPGPDATMVLPVVPAAPASSADDETVVLTTPASPDSDDTVVLTVTPATSAPATESAPPAKRPFWRLPRFAPKQAEAVSPTDLGVAERTNAVTAEAPARPEPVVGATAQRIPPVVRKPMAPRTGASAVIGASPRVEIAVSGLNKSFGQNVAVADVNLEVRAGSFYGIVGPNGAGKTTTLSMITGLLRPDSGSIQVHGVDVWADPIAAKRTIGVLPDRLRLFDRLTGAQLLYYSGVLRGLESETVRARSADLAAAFGLEDALNRLVADYSAGMTKKIALACAMIHSPRVLVLDEPFESVDPVSAVNVTEILQRYVAAGGTVILSSHGMDLIQRVCDHVAIIVQGSVLAAGTIDEVRGNVSLEERFVDLAGGRKVAEGLEWLHNFSD
ncbi:ATP-binding cassette domain-containing protein [Cryobacterium zongtaii]